jgi:hypothetical protein
MTSPGGAPGLQRCGLEAAGQHAEDPDPAPSGHGSGAAMSPSPWKWHWRGDEDVVTPFHAGAVSGRVRVPAQPTGTLASTLWTA